MRIALLAEYGFQYNYIARRLYGNSTYEPSSSEVARVGRIAREEGVSPMEWRRGESTTAKSTVASLLRANIKLKLVAG